MFSGGCAVEPETSRRNITALTGIVCEGEATFAAAPNTKQLPHRPTGEYYNTITLRLRPLGKAV